MKRLCIILLMLFCLPVFVFSENYYALTSGISQISLLKSFKDINHNIFVINKMKNAAKNLSEDDKKTITKYVFGAVKNENTYLLMNCTLRDNLNQYLNAKDITKPLISRMEYYSNNLSSTISKIKLPKNMILYRGIDEKGVRTIFAEKSINDIINKPVTEENAIALRNKINGATYYEKGFMSTAYDINYAKQEKFIFIIKAPKNLQAVLIDGIDLNKPSTKEVLVNKGYKWKVTDVICSKDRKHYKIYVKLIL